MRAALLFILLSGCTALQADRALQSTKAGLDGASSALPSDPDAQLGLQDYLAMAGGFLATGLATYVSVNKARDRRRLLRHEKV